MKHYWWAALAMMKSNDDSHKCLGSTYVCFDERNRETLANAFSEIFEKYEVAGGVMRRQDEAQTRLLMGEVGR
jgi:hypothetical protein